MSNRTSISCVALLSLALSPGCSIEAADPSEELTAETEEALSVDNALTQNALNANSIYPNALNPNALTQNALNPNALNPNALTAIKDPGTGGTLSRQLLKYTVSCALTSSQSFNFSWKDAKGVIHNESYPGWLGIEPSWASQPITLVGQYMVSACLASRVNYYGTQVIISARSVVDPLKTLVGCQEISDYPYIEGAFWGNLFTTTPFVNSCYNAADVANSRQEKRDCATGHLNSDGTVSPCGIIKLVGDCKSVCPKINGAGQYYQDCIEKPGVSTTSTKYVVTTALP